MRPVKFGWLIFLILFIAGGASAYYLNYKQAAKFAENDKAMREIKTLRDQQIKIMESSSRAGEMDEKEMEVLRLLAETKGDMWFLEDIEERMDKSLLPVFSFIGPLKQQEFDNHIQFTRELNVLATFPEFRALLEELEQKRGFIISQLNMTKAGNSDDKTLSVKFQLSCIKIKENFLTQLGTRPIGKSQAADYASSLVLDFPWQVQNRINLDNKVADPFEKFVPKPPVVVDTGPKILPPIDLAGKYTFEGVISIADKQTALIAPDKFLEKGDLLDDMEIMKIEDNTIFLEKDKQPYFIKLPGEMDTQIKAKNISKSVSAKKEEGGTPNGIESQHYTIKK